jgi:hypothetical protein
MAYFTTAELKAYLGITSSSDDVQLGYLPDRVTAAIDQFCNRHFEPEAEHGPAASHTHYFTPLLERDGGDLLDYYTLNLNHDLAELTSITNGDGTAIAAGDVVLLPLNVIPTNFIRIKSSSGKFWTYSGSPEGSVQVAGKWSYSLDIPADVKAAALRWGAHLYRLRTGATSVPADITVSADGSAFASNRIPSDVAQMLKPYIRRS